MFGSLDSYDSKLQSLSSFFFSTHTVLLAHYSSLTSRKSCKVEFSYSFSIKIL